MRAYQLKIVMTELPTVWRTLIVPEKTSWATLHYIIQYAFGWQDAHLYEFSADGATCYTNDEEGIAEYEYYKQNPGAAQDDWAKAIVERPQRAADAALIDDVLSKNGVVNYLYDYGDNWELRITLEESITDYDNNHALCLATGAAGPPEDVGGTWGFMSFLEAWYDPTHSEHNETVTWGSSQGFTDEVDLAKINTFLSRKLPLGSDNLVQLLKLNQHFLPFDEAIAFNQRLEEEKALSTNLLHYYRGFLKELKEEGPFKATAKGNLPVKVVKDLFARGYDYLEADYRDEQVHREDDAWFISTLHHLAKFTGMAARRKGKIVLTKKGEEFLQAPGVENYYTLFWHYPTTYNLGYEEGREILPQFLYRYLISLLARFGGKEREIGFYVDKLLGIYPLLFGRESPDERGRRSFEYGVFRAVMRNFFAEFGLVKTRSKWDPGETKTLCFVQKTELFDDVFLRW